MAGIMGVLQEWADRLALPGLPAATGLLALLLLLLAGLAFLLMPFSVFGLKGRLDSIEAQLDEVQTELRLLAHRLGETPRRAAATEDWVDLQAPPLPEDPPLRAPPIPPPAAWPGAGGSGAGGPGAGPIRRGRAEPRLD